MFLEHQISILKLFMKDHGTVWFLEKMFNSNAHSNI